MGGSSGRRSPDARLSGLDVTIMPTQLIPLYGFVRGDTLGLLVLAHTEDTVLALAASMQQAACMRVPPSKHVSVYHDGVLLAPHLTLVQAGLSALARVDLVPESA
jgi:hypothetical protein